jgi:chromate transporter
VSLHELVGLVFTFNLMTFGNGPVMVPLLQQSLVQERGVLTIDQLLYAFAVARVTPGQANVYVASIGYMLFGWLGALACAAALVLPGYAMLPLLGGYQRFRQAARVRGFVKGLTATSVGLILAATIEIGHSTLATPTAWIVCAATLAMVHGLKWNPILCLAVASALGLVLHRFA